MPLACNNLAKEAAIIPFPKLLVTPPVTKTYFAIKLNASNIEKAIPTIVFYVDYPFKGVWLIDLSIIGKNS
jgi:hypothetical protein